MKNPNSGAATHAGKLTPTEFLILALIWGRHANTLYTLQKETQLSTGALAPALAKLRGKGLLQAELLGPRKRQEFRVPEGAMKEIKEQWYSRNYIADCDAVLKLCKAGRIIDIASAVEYAAGAVSYRNEELRKYTNQLGVVEPSKVDVSSYRSYTELARFYRLLAELKTLEAVSAALNTEYLGQGTRPDSSEHWRRIGMVLGKEEKLPASPLAVYIQPPLLEPFIEADDAVSIVHKSQSDLKEAGR